MEAAKVILFHVYILIRLTCVIICNMVVSRHKAFMFIHVIGYISQFGLGHFEDMTYKRCDRLCDRI